jgi:hypothetical protein
MSKNIWKTLAAALAGAASQQILPALLPFVPQKYAPLVAAAIAVAAAYHVPSPAQPQAAAQPVVKGPAKSPNA